MLAYGISISKDKIYFDAILHENLGYFFKILLVLRGHNILTIIKNNEKILFCDFLGESNRILNESFI